MVIEGESCCQLFLFYFSNKILSVFVKIQQNIQKDKKRKTAMFMLIFVACVIYIITQLFSIQNLLLLSCSQMLGGIAFFFLPYPFISFETFYKVNIKKTVKICKVIGGLLMISAVVFAVLFFV